MHIENNKGNKKLEILGAILGAVVATIFALITAQMGIYHPLIPMAVLVLPMVGIIGLDYLNEERKEKKLEFEEDENSVKKSKYDVYVPKLSPFGVTISIILAYTAVYFSEVLNLVINLKKAGNMTPTMELFLDVTANILKSDWASKYLIEYWIFMTVMAVAFVVTGVVVGLKKKNMWK